MWTLIDPLERAAAARRVYLKRKARREAMRNEATE